ncbi:MAG: hypothetical protein KIT86_17300 [Hydrogenophaga sp.]|nr:hypothetical protein [Hydrogenophaga sp.]
MGDECLSLEWFRPRKEAAAVIEAYRHFYNTLRPQRPELPNSSNTFSTGSSYREEWLEKTEQV